MSLSQEVKMHKIEIYKIIESFTVVKNLLNGVDANGTITGMKKVQFLCLKRQSKE